jgi:hypothetical protein
MESSRINTRIAETVSPQMKHSPSWFSASRSPPHIADDIRSDNELMFEDDAEGMLLPPSSAMGGDVSSRTTPAAMSSAPSSSKPASRRSSQRAIEDLQREVDMALEFFSQEAVDDFSEDDHMTNEDGFQPIHKEGDGMSGGGGECNHSYTSTAATSLSPSDDYGDDTGYHSQQTTSTPIVMGGSGGLSLKHKTKSLLSLPLSLLPSQTKMNCVDEDDFSTASAKFDQVICEELQLLGITPDQHSERTYCVDFESNHSLRNAMEPFLCVAREYPTIFLLQSSNQLLVIYLHTHISYDNSFLNMYRSKA